MSWQKEIEKDILWIVVVCIAVMAIILGGTWAWDRSDTKNDELVLKQFMYGELSVCTEKLGAYGEKVNFNIRYNDATFDNLDVCLEKLGAYGEKVDRPAPLQ